MLNFEAKQDELGATCARQVLATRLRTLRFIRGWSQEKLAEASGLHRTYISSIERAAQNIGLDNLERLAQAFGLTIDEIFTPPRV
jgi:transcriptional regulator with XRE-family HTH domain